MSAKLAQLGTSIWTLSGFIPKHRCDELILFSEHQGYREADVGFREGAKMAKTIRDNYRVNFQDENLAREFWHMCEPHLLHLLSGKNLNDTNLRDTKAAGLNPNFRFYRYDEKQRFKRHIDGPTTLGEMKSRLTFMIYLNDEYEGGETKFDDVTIHPQTGMALLFVHEQKHESLPILRGTKYVLRSDIFYA